MVRRRFAGDADAFAARLTQNLDALFRADVLHVDLPAGKAREDDVAVDHEFLRRAGHSLHAEKNRPLTFVHHAFGFEGFVAAMVEDRQIKGLGIMDDVAHEQVVLHAASVIGKRDRSGCFERSDSGHFPAFDVLRHCAAGEDLDNALVFRVGEDVVDRARVVRAGGSVRHCDD